MRPHNVVRSLVIAVLATTFLYSLTYANHGMQTLPDCGTHTFSADLVKGRTDGMVVHAVHTVGCKTYDYTNLVGYSRGADPTTERAWQYKECQRTGKQDVVNLFDYGWHTTVNPDDVHVTCTPYNGPD